APTTAVPMAPPAAAAATPARDSDDDDAEPDDWRQAPRPHAASALAPALPAWLHEFFAGGNLIVRGGVVVLVFGVSCLLRYVAEHSHVSIEWRLTGVAVAGLVLLGLGWRVRDGRRAYALALQGGGVGILYLTVFAAFRLFTLLPSGAAFALLAAIAA